MAGVVASQRPLSQLLRPGQLRPRRAVGQPTFDVYGVEQDPFALLRCAENALADVDRHIAGFDETSGRLLQQALDPGGPFASTPGPGGTARLDLGGLDLTPVKASDFAKAGNPDHDYPVDPVVADIVKLYRAGAVTMPKAADLYDAGVNMCAQLHITGVDYQYPSTVTKFNEAAHRLGDTMAQIREDLRCSGDALVMAATTYETSPADEPRYPY